MTTLLRGTSLLNNNGVQLFERELFLEAIGSFQLCLDQISEYQTEQEFILVENMTNASDTTCEETKTRDQECDDAASGEPSTSAFHGWSKSAKRSSSTEAGSPFLFSRAIRIREQEGSSHNEHRDTLISAYKAALHYNLALTHHVLLLLRRSGEPRIVVFSSATFLHRHYEAAYLEWKTTAATTFFSRDEDALLDIRLLGLALFNNMGVVFCSELARFREAFECFKAACGVMCCYLDDSSQVLEDDEIYEISMNACLVPSEACPAA